MGSTYDSGSATHHVTLYKSPSGAIVFGAGTVQWGWALDGMHDSESGLPAERVNHLNIRVGVDILATDLTVMQFTINIFSDMAIDCPLCRDSGIPHIRDTGPSLDVTPPTCRIISVEPDQSSKDPNSGNLKHIWITAEAEDVAPKVKPHENRNTLHMDDHQGVVAGVEVSFNQLRWHPLDRVEIASDPKLHARAEEHLRDERKVGRMWRSRVDVREVGTFHEHGVLRPWCRATDDSLNTQLMPTLFEPSDSKHHTQPPVGSAASVSLKAAELAPPSASPDDDDAAERIRAATATENDL